MNVPCDIVNTIVEGRDAVEATCSDCRHKTWSFGRGDPSRRRCLALLASECPEAARVRAPGAEPARNYYYDDEGPEPAYRSERPPDPTPRPWWEKK